MPRARTVHGQRFNRLPLTVEAVQCEIDQEGDNIEDVVAFIGGDAKEAYILPDGRLTVEPGHTPVVLFHQPDSSPAYLMNGDWALKVGKDQVWKANNREFARDFEAVDGANG